MKRDIKYIIKRVIICVLIAFILSFVNKCNVSAQTIDVYLQRQRGIYFQNPSIYNFYDLYNLESPYSQNSYNYKSNYSSTVDSKSYFILYNEIENVYWYFIYNDYLGINVDSKDIKIYLDGNNVLQISVKCTSSTPSDYCNNGYRTISGDTSDFILSNHIISNFSNLSILNSSDINRYDSPISSEYFYSYTDYIPTYLIDSSTFADNWSYYDSNLESLDVFGEQYISSIPSYYTMIEFNNNQAVVFVPKDYSNVPSFTVGDVNFISFNMFYSGLLRESYFNIDNQNEWVFPQDSDLISFSLTEYTTSFPMFYDNDINSFNYNALMFNKLEDSNDVIIYYDSRYFNHYFIEDLELSVFLDISFIDINGNDVVATLSFAPTFEDYWQQGFDTGGDNWVDNSNSQLGFERLRSYFYLVKLPFNFLNSLVKGTCTPLSAQFPHSNSYIVLPCLSSTFETFLGSTPFSYIKYIINGLFLYRIMIGLVLFLESNFDPSTARIEVLDL